MSFAKRRLFLRGDPSFLTDIAVGGRKILAIVEGLEEQSFYRDELRQAAVLHHLTVIGEAVHRLSADLKDDHPEMPWHQIVSVRNRIVHAYFDLEWRILWVTATSDVPDLLAKVEAILREEFPGSGLHR